MKRRLRISAWVIAGALLPSSLAFGQVQPAASGAARDLYVTVGKSLIVESPVNIQRVSIAAADMAEPVAVSPREILVNGKAPGDTSLIVWQQGGNRLLFDLHVRPNNSRLDAIKEQIKTELADQDIRLEQQGESIFLRGTVRDLASAERAATIAATVAKPVNLLHVRVPAQEDQILLKVRFADMDRSAVQELGVNLFSLGALKTPGSLTTGQFSPPFVNSTETGATATTIDNLNLFLFRPDLNLGATIRALQSRSMLQILAEPNLLSMNGKTASFLAGGEVPVPVVQAAGAGSAVTITWREFGVRLKFTPTITPRGTIRLHIEPEVSSLDYSNAVKISGFTVPAISTRKLQTDIELESGQSFVLAGLLDNRVIQSWNKVPGIGDIPLLGKLFRSRSETKNNQELMILVTPQLVKPIPAGQTLPAIDMKAAFMEDTAPKAPGVDSAPTVVAPGRQQTVLVEQLQQALKDEQPSFAPPTPIQIIVPGTAPAGQTAPAIPIGVPASPSGASPGGSK